MGSGSSDTTDADLAAATESALTLYGQRQQPKETPDFLSKSHSELLQEIDKLPDDKKAGWLQAKEKCPALVDEEHRLMFLRCELFNTELAAKRICNYWIRRIELFGQTRAFKPLHLGGDGALSSVHSSNAEEDNNDDDYDDAALVENTMKGLYLGFIRPTMTHDSGGRALLFADPSRFAGYDKNNIQERLGIARAVWYVLHNAIEGNDTVQKLGMVFIAYPHHAKLSYVDRKLMKMNMESISGAIPVRIGAFHICNPPWFFGKIIWPFMKLILPERMKKRVRVHTGSQEKVLNNLKEFGLGQEVLPSEIGGDVILDTDAFIHDMKQRGL